MKRLALVAAVTLALAGCAAEQPPVSPSVQKYYDENVAGRKAVLPSVAPSLSVAVIGDSYSAGTGAGDPSLGWVARLAHNQLWNVTNLARGGTGYTTSVTADAQKACTLDYCPSYPEMIDEAVKAKPAVILVAGGRNDSGVPIDEESEAIKAFYERVRAQAPAAKIVAFNVLWDNRTPPGSVLAMSAVVKESVESVGGIYLDAQQPLTKAEGLVALDGVHPNAAGHAAIFEAKLALLQKAEVAIR